MKRLSLVLIGVIILSAGINCKKDTPNPPPPPPPPPPTTGPPPPPAVNRPPKANAGPDQVLTLPVNATTLNGTASSDSDGNNLTYYWRSISGPGGGSITSENTAHPFIFNLPEGQHTYKLEVWDGFPNSFSYDTIVVTVVRPSYCTGNRQEVPLQFTLLSNLPYPMNLPNIYATGNKLLVMTRNIDMNSTFPLSIYDRTTQTWTSSLLSMGRQGMEIIAAGNKLIFAGGIIYDQTGYNFTCTDKIDIYDIATNSWSDATLSEARFACKATLVGNKILFSGGLKTDRTFSNKVDIYDLSTNSWSVTQFPGTKRMVMTAVSSGNKVFLCGGYTAFQDYTGYGEVFGEPVNVIDVYDANTWQWSQATMLKTKSEFGAVVFDEKLYLAGGYDPIERLWQLDVEILDVNNLNRIVSCLIQPNSFFDNDVVVQNNKLIFAGDRSISGISPNKIDIYDPASQTWSIGTLSNGMLPGRLASAIVSVGNELYAIFDNKLYKVDF